MNKIKLKNLTQEYSGRCKIIPCCDLPKMEDDFDGLKDDIIDCFKRKQIICGWGYYQTHYIHLPDISQLSAVLSNLDDWMLEEVYNEEQE